jgi:phage terminase Nu1 subunit (DNA packaging protein)
MAKWKAHAKTTALKEPALRGLCYVSYDENGKSLVLNLMPVAGKIKTKENLIIKAMKTVVNPSRCSVVITEGEFGDDLFDKMEAATEAMEEVADDVEGDAMEDAVEDMRNMVEEAQKTANPAQAKKLQEMAKDIEDLENLLEQLAAADDAPSIQKLDKDIRTIFSKYAGSK